MNEFEIIKNYLNVNAKPRKDVLHGIGDDCALLKVPRGQKLAISMDTLIGDVHFMATGNAADIAHKAVAVNLSDLASASAEPAWLTLSLTLPENNECWLKDFSMGLKSQLDYYGIQLVGGDTCRGPLSITIQAHGFVPENVFLTRSGASVGELICITGSLGDAAIGLQVAQGKIEASGAEADYLLNRYLRPTPRIAAGIALRGLATAAIDISDGLLADVGHISELSEVGVLLSWEKIPLSDALKSVATTEQQMQAALTGGDDYELCFTVAEDQFEATKKALNAVGTQCTAIGRMTGKPGVKLYDHKKEVTLDCLGYQHF